MNILYNIIEEKELLNVGEVKRNTIIRGDCLKAMSHIADNSIDAIITDLPYG